MSFTTSQVWTQFFPEDPIIPGTGNVLTIASVTLMKGWKIEEMKRRLEMTFLVVRRANGAAYLFLLGIR